MCGQQAVNNPTIIQSWGFFSPLFDRKWSPSLPLNSAKSLGTARKAWAMICHDHHHISTVFRICLRVPVMSLSICPCIIPQPTILEASLCLLFRAIKQIPDVWMHLHRLSCAESWGEPQRKASAQSLVERFKEVVSSAMDLWQITKGYKGPLWAAELIGYIILIKSSCIMEIFIEILWICANKCIKAVWSVDQTAMHVERSPSWVISPMILAIVRFARKVCPPRVFAWKHELFPARSSLAN